MKSTVSGILAALVFAASMCVASAAPTTPGGLSLVIAKIGTTENKGLVNWTEVSAAAQTKFSHLDVDRDDLLNTEESTGIFTHDEFVAADTDKDGLINRAEYIEFSKQLFQSADTNGDGMLQATELSTTPGVKLVSLLAY